VTNHRLSARRHRTYRRCQFNAQQEMEKMNGRMLKCAAALCIAVTLAGCASAPPQEMSILDAMAARSTGKPLSCAAMDAATLCVQTSRLDKRKSCSCVGRQQLIDGNPSVTF
jgi:hypothetical protein